ncbi:MAG: DegT/DnrJ/EryC1/StrS family aminotransferase [Deltaproteobacteria bacterium]|nr:DegT/DnrJ/EryC1/StrS family aminotransferase [Deltaproteobacteria bacterium]
MQAKSPAIPFARPMISEEEKRAVLKVLDGPILVHGPLTKEFETSFAKFTGAPFAVSVSSCTAALHLSYVYLGIGAGDEVIVPAQTHVATAHAVELCGARPVFVDAESETGNIDLDQIEKSITPRTRALSVVHYLGMPVNMERVAEIAKKKSLFVVEDCALAIGSYFKGCHVGLFGDVGCFSFYPVKHMTTIEGGMLITQDEQISKRVSQLKAFGYDRTIGERTLPGLYDVTSIGFNYRLNEIEAALGIEQLKKVALFLKQRQRNHEILSRELSQLDEIRQFKTTAGEYRSSYYCLSVHLTGKAASHRNLIVKYLNENGVGTSIYYPQPVPLMHYYQAKYGHREAGFPVAASISKHSIALPVGPHLKEEQMLVIAETFKKAIEMIKKGSFK